MAALTSWEDDDFGLGIGIRTKEKEDWTRLDLGGDGKIKAGRVKKVR